MPADRVLLGGAAQPVRRLPGLAPGDADQRSQERRRGEEGPSAAGLRSCGGGRDHRLRQHAAFRQVDAGCVALHHMRPACRALGDEPRAPIPQDGDDALAGHGPHEVQGRGLRPPARPPVGEHDVGKRFGALVLPSAAGGGSREARQPQGPMGGRQCRPEPRGDEEREVGRQLQAAEYGHTREGCSAEPGYDRAERGEGAGLAKEAGGLRPPQRHGEASEGLRSY
mmetsp:Transcript_4468/g.12908  ORF Transcript_4468/g.12908 Transcript_4468/m.12908 type:complete len:225 (-) Transcript_4468:156-830(-)